MRYEQAIDTVLKGGCAYREAWGNGQREFVGASRGSNEETIRHYLPHTNLTVSDSLNRLIQFVHDGAAWTAFNWAPAKADKSADDWEVMIGRWGEKLS